jgi:hypothetical protein
MPTIHVVDGYTVKVYTRDHRPPHVHVFHNNGEAIITIGRPGEDPEVREVYRMHTHVVVRAIEIVRENQAEFWMSGESTMATDTRLDPALAQQIAEARRAGQHALRTEPRTASATYDSATGEVRVRMHNGASFAIPAAAMDELRGASVGDLARVEVPPSGYGLHWPALDVAIALEGMLEVAFGGLVRSALARKAGATRSSAKARAARENGSKGGRPRKAQGGPIEPPASHAAGSHGTNRE